MFRYLPDGFIDYATYNLKEILQFLQNALGLLLENF